MGFKNLVLGQVRKAFKQIGDLADDVTLVQKNPVSFNFSTKLPELTSPTNLVVKGIKLSKTKETSNREAVKLSYLLKSEDVEFPDIYDKAIIDGTTYTISTPINDDGYLITINLNRSV